MIVLKCFYAIYALRKVWTFRVISFLILTLIFDGCVETFEIPTANEFQNVLIVEATITDVFGVQEIKLSRTGPLGSDELFPELGASIQIRQGNGTAYAFLGTSSEIYRSEIPFAAEPGVSYVLEIQTQSGEVFSSSPQQLPRASTIALLEANSIVDEDRGEGVQIFLSSTAEGDEPQFYRYEYEEAYRIVAPQWSSFETYVVTENPPNVGIRRRQQEELICYGVSRSTEILQFTTEGLVSNAVIDFPLRFLEKRNPFIAHRYSILVKQFSISPEAYRYYRTLRELSGQGNLLSQQQPGFLPGNVIAEDGNIGDVSGYFCIASLSERRIFFDYDDFYDGVNILPAYPADCNDTFVAPVLVDEFGNSPLIEAVQNESYEFLTRNAGFDSTQFGGYIMVPRICGDCTVLGSNVPPDFWVD